MVEQLVVVQLARVRFSLGTPFEKDELLGSFFLLYENKNLVCQIIQ